MTISRRGFQHTSHGRLHAWAVVRPCNCCQLHCVHRSVRGRLACIRAGFCRIQSCTGAAGAAASILYSHLTLSAAAQEPAPAPAQPEEFLYECDERLGPTTNLPYFILDGDRSADDLNTGEASCEPTASDRPWGALSRYDLLDGCSFLPPVSPSYQVLSFWTDSPSSNKMRCV